MPVELQSPSIEEVREMVSLFLDGLDAREPISAIVLFKVNPRREEHFTADLRALTSATRRLAGLKTFTFHKRRPFAMSPDDAPEFFIYEEWNSVYQFRHQWNSQHLKRFQSRVLENLAGPPELRFYYGSEAAPGTLARAPVLATGQKRCWDGDGEPVQCSGWGTDGAVRAGVPFAEPRYTDNGDGTVTDNRTGLVWLKDANAFGPRQWMEAVSIPRQLCDGQCNLTDGSQPGDWRLPNVRELSSLADLDSDRGPAFPDRHPFQNLEAANYWSSTSVMPAPALSWYLAFAVAPPVFDLKLNAMRLWPVKGSGNGRVARTGQPRKAWNPRGEEIPVEGSGQDGEFQMGAVPPSPRFIVNNDGTVTDALTGLTWLRNANAFESMSWEAAVRKCNGLHDGQAGLTDGSRAGDWRLPNVNELLSLNHYGYPPPGSTAPTVDPNNPFDEIQPTLYWSSTTVASAPNQARFVFFGMASAVWDHKCNLLKCWPVKGGLGLLDEQGDDGRRRQATLIIASS